MAKKMKGKRETETERMEREERIAKKRARNIAKRAAAETVDPVEPTVDEGAIDEVCEEI